VNPRPKALTALCCVKFMFWTLASGWIVYRQSWGLLPFPLFLLFKDVSLWNLKPWSRKLGVIMSWMGLVGYFAVLVPAVRWTMTARGAGTADQPSLNLAAAWLVFFVFTPLALLAAAALYVLNRPDVKAAFVPSE